MIKMGYMTWQDALLKIAKHYGGKEQLGQLQEECGELIVAAHKQVKTDERATYAAYSANANLIEEIADVEIMIEQIKLLYSIDKPVEETKQSKVLRQLNRIDKQLAEDTATKIADFIGNHFNEVFSKKDKESKNAKM